MSETPTTNGSNGERDARGRFQAGNPGGPGGSAYAARVLELKTRLLAAITDKDWDDITANLIRMAKGDDPVALKLFYDRTIGRVPQDLNINTPEMPNPQRDLEVMRQLLGILQKA